MSDELKSHVEKVLSPYAEENGIDVIELSIQHKRDETAIIVIADRPKGGITIDECTDLNRFLADKLEEDGTASDDFTVEVSSPGLDRPMKTKKDFVRNIGNTVDVYLKEKVDDKLQWTGKINEVTDSNVVINVKDKSLAIPLEAINKAMQVI